MTITRILLGILTGLWLVCSAHAQGVQQGTQQGGVRSSAPVRTGTGVATQPSNNPFSNPIGQGVPPAASSNPRYNNNRTYVPLNSR